MTDDKDDRHPIGKDEKIIRSPMDIPPDIERERGREHSPFKKPPQEKTPEREKGS